MNDQCRKKSANKAKEQENHVDDNQKLIVTAWGSELGLLTIVSPNTTPYKNIFLPKSMRFMLIAILWDDTSHCTNEKGVALVFVQNKVQNTIYIIWCVAGAKLR